MLMFYFITQFFRRSPTNPGGNNATMPINPAGGVYSPGNLYGSGELMDLYLFLNEEENYQYDAERKPIWEVNGWKYGDWSPKGTLTKFLEFPITEVKRASLRFRSTIVFRLECEKQRLVVFARRGDETRPFDRSD